MSRQQTFPADCLENGRIAFDIPAQVTAYCRAKFAGKRVDVEVRARKSKRSLQANAAFHACLTRWATEKDHDAEELKDDLLALQWGYHVRQNQLTGEVVKRLVKPHTSRLNTTEFTELFELAAIEAAKDEHVMVMPQEYKEMKAAEAKKAARDAAKAQRAA